MAVQQKGKSTSIPASPDVAEAVAWLDCRDKPSSQLYVEIERLIQASPARNEVLFLILRHLERIDGSLTGFVVVLDRILRTSPVQVVLGDPSGYVSLVLACLDRAPQFRTFRPDPDQRHPRPALIVDSSRTGGDLLGQVLAAFGHPVTLVHTAGEARKALTNCAYGLVLLDLDLPRTQSFGIAEMVKDQLPQALLVGMTGADEPWAQEVGARYGMQRILPKPASILDLLGTIQI